MKCKVVADVFQLDVRHTDNNVFIIENEVTDTEFRAHVVDYGNGDNLVVALKDTSVLFTIDKFSLIDNDTILVPRGTYGLEGSSNYFSELLNCLQIPVINITDIKSTMMGAQNTYIDEVEFLIDYYVNHELGYENSFIPFTPKGAQLCNKIQKEIRRCKDTIKDILIEANNDPERKYLTQSNTHKL